MTSFQIKLIAIIVMTIDHLENILGQTGLFPNMPMSKSYDLVCLMHSIGRVAFPLFAFLLAEGAQKTRSMPKYIGRLALFALISEPFFYFSDWRNSPTFSGLLHNIITLNWGNVFFTLTLGAVAIYAYQILERKQVKCKYILFTLIGFLIMLSCGYLGTDYGMAGILLIILLFLAKNKKQKCAVILLWVVFLYGFGQAYNPIFSILRDCIFASLSCVFIWFYNGQRGRKLKWSFYIYYPLHLFVLTVIHAALQ